MLWLMTDFLNETRQFSEFLQTRNLDLASAADMSQIVLDQLNEKRSSMVYFEIVETETDRLVKKWDIAKGKEKRKRRVPLILSESFVSESRMERNGSDENSFRTSVAIPILDCMIAEMNRRFNETNITLMGGVQALHPASSSFMEIQPIMAFAGMFSCSSYYIEHEIHQLKRLVERKTKDKPLESLQVHVM